MKIYLTILFVLMSSSFLFIGLKVLLSKKPFFFSARYVFAFMALALGSAIISILKTFILDVGGNFKLIALLELLMFACILVSFWFQMKGYIAIGVKDDSFRQALLFSLNKNNLPFEEYLSIIKLTSINEEIQVAIQSSIEVGQFKLKEPKNSRLLHEIVTGINEYYTENNIGVSNVSSIFYIVMGIIMLAFAGAWFCLFP